MAYECVIFDFFGTLTTAIRRGPAHDRVALALGCDPAAFTRLLDRTYPDRIRGLLGDRATVLRRLARELGSNPGPHQVARALQLRTRAIRDSIRLRPDAVHTLLRLRAAGVRTGLVSDCTEELPTIFPELAIAGLFDATVFSVDVGAGKPDPRIFLTAARRLAACPTSCLYVGDGGGRELSGAEAVGMRAVRLAARDLHEHLVYDAEPAWAGWRVPALCCVPELVLADRRSGPAGRRWLMRLDRALARVSHQGAPARTSRRGAACGTMDPCTRSSARR
jgi:putative hydrolase of the HAD superfamily